MITATRQVKPFLKWAGGKGQLINQIAPHLPSAFKTGGIKKYFEPFLGGGALFFWLSEQYNFESVYLYEINACLSICYQAIQQSFIKLVKELRDLELEYFSAHEKKREKFYYDKREEFNAFLRSKTQNGIVRQSALLIFLNKTCFNGLYRVNSQGEFNVPFGQYKKPTICNEETMTYDNKRKSECKSFIGLSMER